MNDEQTEKLSYRDAGVDIDKGNAFVQTVKSAVAGTQSSNVLAGIGGFAACFELDLTDLKQPIICACTDGVGTKLKLAMTLNRHHGIGIDLVAMCANDLIVGGAKPLFFLDYYATGKLEPVQSKQIIEGIVEGCRLADMSLIGGETAEMPGFYENNHYDLAGFNVGVVDKSKMIDGSKVNPGDVLLGLQSSGFHSNGYSLVRRLLDTTNSELNQSIDNSTLGDLLIEPTRIYVRSILKCLKQFDIHSMAHITGGGIVENLERVLPDHVNATINLGSWEKPRIYQWLDNFPQVDTQERFRTFNEGLGMILCVAADKAEAIAALLTDCGETVSHVGQVHDRATTQSTEKVSLNG